jgi:hypothetical protein
MSKNYCEQTLQEVAILNLILNYQTNGDISVRLYDDTEITDPHVAR